ncbi:hypothetical protein M2281_003747 [Mesorhizobium soli]|nr:hypothetical protein [Mesorhizobium soli]MDH6233136.1 hypothetical protein [Mesorhizobium soli]
MIGREMPKCGTVEYTRYAGDISVVDAAEHERHDHTHCNKAMRNAEEKATVYGASNVAQGWGAAQSEVNRRNGKRTARWRIGWNFARMIDERAGVTIRLQLHGETKAGP